LDRIYRGELAESLFGLGQDESSSSLWVEMKISTILLHHGRLQIFVIVLFLLAIPLLYLGDGGLRWNRIFRVNFIDHIWHTPAIS